MILKELPLPLQKLALRRVREDKTAHYEKYKEMTDEVLLMYHVSSIFDWQGAPETALGLDKNKSSFWARIHNGGATKEDIEYAEKIINNNSYEPLIFF